MLFRHKPHDQFLYENVVDILKRNINIDFQNETAFEQNNSSVLAVYRSSFCWRFCLEISET